MTDTCHGDHGTRYFQYHKCYTGVFISKTRFIYLTFCTSLFLKTKQIAIMLVLAYSTALMKTTQGHRGIDYTRLCKVSKALLAFTSFFPPTSLSESAWAREAMSPLQSRALSAARSPASSPSMRAGSMTGRGVRCDDRALF